MSGKIEKTIQGFKIFPLQYSSTSTSCHNLYIKEHSVRLQDETKPAGQTLFVLNVPPYANEGSLKQAFGAVGGIKNVIIEESEDSFTNNDGFKRAFIVFKRREDLLGAMKLTHLNPLSSSQHPLKMGIEKWMQEYNSSLYSTEKLQDEVETFLKGFDKKEAKSKNQKEVVDDEGWTVVTRGGRKPGISRKESVENKLNDKAKKNSKKKELKNFYTFQIRESQMKNLVALRKNFEEAKNKVEQMKKARKFKPY